MPLPRFVADTSCRSSFPGQLRQQQAADTPAETLCKACAFPASQLGLLRWRRWLGNTDADSTHRLAVDVGRALGHQKGTTAGAKAGHLGHHLFGVQGIPVW